MMPAKSFSRFRRAISASSLATALIHKLRTQRQGLDFVMNEFLCYISIEGPSSIGEHYRLVGLRGHRVCAVGLALQMAVSVPHGLYHNWR